MIKKIIKKKEQFQNLDWKRLWQYPKPYIKSIIIAGFLLVFSTSFSLGMPLLTAEMVEILQGNSSYTLVQLSVFMVGVIIIQSISSLIGTYIIAKIDANILASLRRDTYNHLTGLPFKFFTDNKSSEMVSRMNYDIMGINTVTTGNVISTAQSLIRLIGGLIGMIYISPFLTLIALAIAPFFMILSVSFGRQYFKLARISHSIISRISGAIFEAAQNIRIIKSFTREEHERKRFNHIVDAGYKNSMRAAWLGALYSPLVSFIVYSGTLLVFWFGGQAALNGDLKTSELVAFLMFMGIFATSIRMLGGLYQDIMRAMGSLKKVFDMMILETEELTTGKNIVGMMGNIEFKNVSFNYGPDFKPIFKNLDLKIYQGETLALIGPSGVSKSTLLNLIPSFYEINAGQLLFDDIDSREIFLKNIRSQVGIVPQDLQLFNGTIFDNVLFGNLKAKKGDVIEACKSANAHEFIMELPAQYNTLVGEDSVKLSYGQRQRIAVARVILKDPAILLLDEPTSALDLESELIVQDALKRLMEGRTTVIAGHHLNTLKFSDRIAVLGEQKIIELGTHEQLMKLGGYYADIRTRMES